MLLPVVIPTQCLQFENHNPALGEMFALRLSAHDESDGAVDPSLMVTLHAVATPLQVDDVEADAFPVRLTAGTADIYYQARRPLSGPVDLPLTLFDGADIGVPHAMPKVVGRVTRLRLMEELFRWDERQRAHINDLHDLSRRRLAELDRWPRREVWWPREPETERADYWDVTAVVVDLDVPDA